MLGGHKSQICNNRWHNWYNNRFIGRGLPAKAKNRQGFKEFIEKMPKIDTLDALEEHEEHEDDYQTNSNW